MTRAAIVLSGGGVKAAAHIGAMRALAEAGIEPATYVGTSGGSLVAALLATGMPHDALIEQVTRLGGHDVVRANLWTLLLGWRVDALLRPAPLRRAVERMVPARRFAEVKQPLRVTAVDAETGALVVFGTGAVEAPLVDALCASCALPMYYPPVTIAGHRYVDGGLRAVLPIWAADTTGCDVVVAVDIGPGFDDERAAAPSRLPRMVRVADTALGILMAQQTQSEVARWRVTPGQPPLLYIRPRTRSGDTFLVDRIPAYLGAGYDAAVEALAAWRSAGAPAGGS
ncbi:MAG: patatin-like phospholipase family protein [Gemmatimonadota bacterium]